MIQIPEKQSPEGTLKNSGELVGQQGDEVQQFTKRYNFKGFFSSLRAVYVLSYPITTPLLSSDGITLLQHKASIIEWWREHFSSLCNRPSTADPSAKKAIMDDLDLPPTLDGVTEATMQTSISKASILMTFLVKSSELLDLRP